MNEFSAAAWAGLALAVVTLGLTIIVWVQASRRRHHPRGGLHVSLQGQHLGVASAGEASTPVAYLNLRLTNDSERAMIVDSIGYRRAGQRRPTPIRDFDVPSPSALNMAMDRLPAPPYTIQAGESLTVTIYAPALCAPDDLAGIYLHTSDGALLWLPPEELGELTRSCTWVSATGLH